jgi:hypothetical protein
LNKELSSAASLRVNARMSDVLSACVLPNIQKTGTGKCCLTSCILGSMLLVLGLKKRIAQTLPRPTADVHVTIGLLPMPLMTT